MLNCFTVVHNCPSTFKPFGETGAFVVWVGNVKWNSTLTWAVEGPTVVFLLGYWKQEIFPNTFQIFKSKHRKKGISSFKDLLKLFCEGPQNVLHTLTAVSDHCWEIREVLLLKTSPHFQLSNCLFVLFSPLFPLFLLFPQPLLDLLADAYEVSPLWQMANTLPGGQFSDFPETGKNDHPQSRVFFFFFSLLSVDSFPDI